MSQHIFYIYILFIYQTIAQFGLTTSWIYSERVKLIYPNKDKVTQDAKIPYARHAYKVYTCTIN